LENGQRVSISYFGAHGHLPLGVALLLAAVLGILLAVIAGTGRILQLRTIARRHRKLDARRATLPRSEPAPQAETRPADVDLPPSNP
jgi:Lipopolysaccharide assembly protein A domain